MIVSVALAMVPRGLRRRYSDKLTLVADTAKDKIADAVADSVLASFDLTQMEVEFGPPLGSGPEIQAQGMEGE